MKILAVDTSSKAASCALWQDGALLGEFFVNNGFTHSQTIMPMLQELLETSGVGLNEVDRFAVSVGPGSFTGLRIGLSAVKGMAMASGKPCVPVSTLESLAYNVRLFPGIVVPTMDARCSQVYTAIFRCGNTVERLEEDQAIPIAGLGEKIRRLSDSGPVMLVGDGAQLCLDTLGGELPGLRLCPENLRHQRSGSVAEIAALAGNTIPALELEPAYLRLPQAQRELMKKKGGAV